MILVGIVSIASACSETVFEGPQPQQTGTLSVQIEPEIYVNNATKAVSAGPDVNEFKIEIYKYVSQGLIRLYRDTYENTVDKKIALNAADYMVHARHGDSLGVGFNAIYYAAQANLTVHPQTDEVVRLEAKMANAKVAVNYGDNLKFDWPEYYVKVKTTTKGGRKRSLQFSKTETRAGYMPAGQFVVELYIKVGEDWMYYHSPEMTINPNDFVTFNVETEKANGNLSLTATVDNGVDVIEKSYELSSDWLPKDAPVIKTFDANGNDFTNKTYSIVEADDKSRSDLKADIVAPGLVDHCYLEVTSDYLAALGVPQVVDLAADMEPAVEAALKSVGLKWMVIKGQRLGYVDFSGVSKWLVNQVCDPNNLFNATFSIDVKDQRQAMGEAQSAPITFAQGKPVFNFYDIPSYNCWAWQIKNITAYLTSGNPRVLVMEYKKSTEGDSAWKVLETTSGNPDDTDKFYNLLNTSAGTTYNFRLTYNGNPLTRIFKNATTESAAQVGNSGFENWTQQTYEFNQSSWGRGESPMKWYQPWSGNDQWWDTNARASMKYDLTIGYTWFKSFPLVHYSTDAHSGSRSAQLTVANVGNSNSTWATTGTWYIGQLFLGRGNDNADWKVSSEGHAFTSRPYGFSFWYKYAPNGSDTGSVRVVVKSGSTELASIASTISSASDWTQMRVSLGNYKNANLKATHIYVYFLASTSSSHSPVAGQGGSYIEIAGNNRTGDAYRIKLSSLLKVDDIAMIYEPF